MPTVEPEMVAVHGFIDRAGAFTLRRCYSTRFIRRSHLGHDGYQLEVVGPDGQLLQRTYPEVVAMENCGPEGVRRWKVTGYIGVHERAAGVRLMAHGRVLWQRGMLPEAALEVNVDTDRASRDRPLMLHLRYSEPGPEAFVQLVYQWGERQFQVLSYSPPSREIPVDMRGLPGGDRCRFVVHYSNGIRSAGAATRPFSLERRGPWLVIVSPTADARVAAGQPVELVGQLVDDERPGGAVLQRDLEWWLDDEPVGRGPLACVQEMPPGHHTVRLLYRHREAAVQVGVDAH